MIIFYQNLFFEEIWGITRYSITEEARAEANLALKVNLLPLESWNQDDIVEDNVFDAIEFFYDRVSKPISQAEGFAPDIGTYFFNDKYDREEGRAVFRGYANRLLADYGEGFYLSEWGEISLLGRDGTQLLFEEDVPVFGDENIDEKVGQAIRKWRSRHRGVQEMKEAIRELADAFEMLRNQGITGLCRKDEGAIFEIANKFSIRHNKIDQKRDYPEHVWYPWMFQFYMGTLFASAKLFSRASQEQEQEDEI